MTKSILNLTGVTLLSKGQMKTVAGAAGTCAWMHSSGFIMHSISLEEVKDLRNTYGGGRWCCDSCGTASWLQVAN